MVPAPLVAGLFKGRQFEPEVILLAVGWYLLFSLSYRDVEDATIDFFLPAKRDAAATERFSGQSLGR
jgi:transposase-like protein